MLPRRGFVVVLGLLAAGCLTPTHIERRPLSFGMSREFPGDVARVSGAADQALDTIDLVLYSPETVGESRVVRFHRPVSADGWGEVGRLVVTPAGDGATRVTVAVLNRYRLQPTRRSEADLANQIFARIDVALTGP